MGQMMDVGKLDSYNIKQDFKTKHSYEVAETGRKTFSCKHTEYRLHAHPYSTDTKPSENNFKILPNANIGSDRWDAKLWWLCSQENEKRKSAFEHQAYSGTSKIPERKLHQEIFFNNITKQAHRHRTLMTSRDHMSWIKIERMGVVTLTGSMFVWIGLTSVRCQHILLYQWRQPGNDTITEDSQQEKFPILHKYTELWLHKENARWRLTSV